jgi:RND family efflux transporter MFP subunit
VAGPAACSGDSAESDGVATASDPHVLAPSEVGTVALDTLAGSVLITGTLRPWREADVRAQVPGAVTEIRVERGDRVAAGQVMAVLDAEGIRSQAAGAEAQVAAARAAVALALRQLESARRLHEAGALSDIDLQSAEAGYESAQAQLAAARAQATGATESAERATIRSPIEGEVSRRVVNEGEAVQPSQTLFRVVNSESLELYGQIPVTQAIRVRSGMPVEFTVEALPGRTFDGAVAQVEPTANPDTRQVGVYLRIPNHDRELLGGVFASGRVLTHTREEVLVVPESAVRREGERSFVWVVEEGHVRRRDVTTGVRDAASGRVQILAGVEAGDRVITVPGRLEDGEAVRIAGPAGGGAEDGSGAGQTDGGG